MNNIPGPQLKHSMLSSKSTKIDGVGKSFPDIQHLGYSQWKRLYNVGNERSNLSGDYGFHGWPISLIIKGFISLFASSCYKKATACLLPAQVDTTQHASGVVLRTWPLVITHHRVKLLHLWFFFASHFDPLLSKNKNQIFFFNYFFILIP